MNITIFGGTGPAGLLVIRKALDSGHTVTVYARNSAKIKVQHGDIHVIEGELSERNKITEAVKGADAVISLLGPKNNANSPVISNGTKNIISAMQQNKVRRLIAAVSSSYRDPKDKFQFGFDFSVLMLKVIGKNILSEIVETGQQIVNSQLDWTMVRLPVLSDSPVNGNLNIGYTGDGKVSFFSLNRKDLADFMVRQLQDQTYLRKAPVVSN